MRMEHITTSIMSSGSPSIARGYYEGEVKAFVEEHIFDIQGYHPDIED